MTQNTIISPADYKRAHYSTSRIGPAIAALEKIDLQSLGYNRDAAQRLDELKQFLNGVNEFNKSIVLAGDDQYDRRPTKIINKAATRLMEIPRDIELEQAKIKAKLEARAMKAGELARRFSPDEIDKIVPPVAQEEIDKTAAAVAALETEAAKIEAFLGDAPRYDTALLQGTTLYSKED